jgi:hypothetical protein
MHSCTFFLALFPRGRWHKLQGAFTELLNNNDLFPFSQEILVIHCTRLLTGNIAFMYITIDMVFSKEYIQNFAFALSENDKALEFPKRDKLNSIIRRYLAVAGKDYKPSFKDNVTKMVVPVNGRHRAYPNLEYLPEKNYKLLESDFEDLFFSMFHRIDSAGFLAAGKRKEAREKFLAACNITSEVLSEDAFRKLFDRYRKKKEDQISGFLSNPKFDLLTFYKSGIKNFIHTTSENVQI